MAYNRTYYFNFISDAGISWRLEMYDQIATGTYQDKVGTLGPKASEMKYGSEGSKMFAPLKPSTFAFEFMVTDQTAANYIKQLKIGRQERDVYVAIYRETVSGSNSPIYPPYFAGQVLMDLSDDPDIPLPYPITIKAVDGIASLKYYDYLPATTTQLASHIYDIGETYIPDPTNAGGQYDPWQHCIEIISNCLSFSGEFTTAMGNPSSNLIFTNVRWFNGEHPNTNIDPLRSTRIKPNMFYTEENQGSNLKYKAKSCYDVLQSLCKAWGMRMYYFAGIYYFTQLNEWRNVDTGTQAIPVNMKRHSYQMDGSTHGSGNAITRWWGKYQMPLTNQVLTGEYKNHKLAGGKYAMLPAFKRVQIDFMNVDNVNSFTSFPLLPTGGTTAPTTAGTYWEFSSLGTYTFDGINNQAFFNRIYLAITNNGITPGNLTLGWAMVVRPAGTGTNTLNTSPQANGWTHYNLLDINNSPPNQWINNTIQLNTGSMPNTPQIAIGIGNTTVDITTNTYANWPYFPASVFTAGDWEIGYYIRSDTTAAALYWSEHGRFVPTGVSNPYTSPWQNNVNYQNVATTQGINASEFAPIINGAVGAASTTTNVEQTGDDTAYEEVKDIIMGDTGSNLSQGCIQIYTGTIWKPSDFSGVWGIDTLAGGNSFSQQLAEDIINAQAKSLDRFTVSTTFDASESVYWNDGTANRPQWACPFTKFMTQPNAYQGMVQKSFIMHTGSYDFLTDTWKWVLYEQNYFNVGTTVIVTTDLGVNSGLSGGAGNPTPVDDNYSNIAPPPNPESGNQVAQRLLQQQQIQPVATIRAGQYLSAIVGIPSLTITSLSVKKLPAAIFKIGDKLVLQTASNDTRAIASEDTNPQYNTNRIEFVVSANQLIDAETISVTSKTIYQNISVGDTITFNVENLYSQYQNKTEGSIAGFEVDADGLTKGGVEITGWLDSDTMTGATATNVPTAESVKAYVDASAGTTPTALSVFSMLTCTTSTITAAADGVANAVVMKFDNEGITEGPTGSIVSYGNGGIEGVENSQFCWQITADEIARYFEFQWNVTSNTNTVNNRILSGIRIENGIINRGTITWSEITPTTSYIYDRGTGSIRKGSTAGSILISMPGGTSDRYYRMIFWREATSNNGVKSESVLNGTQMTIKQLK
tara:strand:- start:1901 stop:5341 length:3441 start_codon:yes stop_codon:yes gene_type:complete